MINYALCLKIKLIPFILEPGKLMMDLASEKSASAWLTALPIKQFTNTIISIIQ